jgi:tetratricopeptide (TPR) repeat protein
MSLFGPKENSLAAAAAWDVLVTAIKSKTACFRVSRTSGVEAHDRGSWTPMPAFRDMEAKLRLPIIQRLREMSRCDDSLFYNCIFQVMDDDDVLHGFNTCYARGASDAAIVLVRFTPHEDVYDEKLWRRASTLLGQTEQARARDEVLSLVREAVAVVPEADGAFGYVLRDAGDHCARVGLFDASVAYHERALALLDERHRTNLATTIGMTLENANRIDDAIRWYERAFAEAESVGPAHGITPIDQLACAWMQQGDLDAAERHLARAEALSVNVFGAGAASEVTLRNSRVRILRARGENAAAEAIALDAHQQARRFGLADVAEGVEYELAELALARGDANAAVTYFREGLKAPGIHPFRAHYFVQLAKALHALGKREDALVALRSAAVIAEGALAHDHPIRIDLDRELALHGATSPYR